MDNWETHTKNPLITKVFREMNWVEERGSGQKNIRRYMPLYYDHAQIEISNEEKYVFTMTYRDPKEFEMDEDNHQLSVNKPEESSKSGPSRDQVIILNTCISEKKLIDIMAVLKVSNRSKFRQKQITTLIENGLLAMTVPNVPKSRLQRYYTTDKGREFLQSHS